MSVQCGNSRHPDGAWHDAAPLPYQGLSGWAEAIRQWWRRRKWGCGCPASKRTSWVWCPECGILLNDGRSEVYDSREGLNFICRRCDFWSVWDFSAPVPLWLNRKDTNQP